MPFCTACGRRNPDDARFCAQCGTRLVSLDDEPGGQGQQGAPGDDTGQTPEVPGETPGETTATIAVGGSSGGASGGATGTGPSSVVDSSDRQLSAVDAAAVDALPVGHALLVVQRGPSAGSRFLLDSDFVGAGRHPDSEIFLDDVTVSRRHAEFHRDGATFAVNDVGSLNGTYVNRDRIDRVQLKDGDEVQIGKYRLVFFAGHEGA